MIATESNYKTDALREMWVAPVTRHAKPFHHLKVDAITQDDIMSVVEPIWNEIPATAQQLLNKLGRILAFATAKRWRSGNNPADWKVLKYLLSKPRKLTKGHRAALPYPEVPAFVATLRTQPNVTARALEFLILSACRANEALQLKWDEIDLASESFTVPASRMKAGKAHVVPLTGRMVAILEEMAACRMNDYVFPGMKLGRPLTLHSLHHLMRGIRPATLHGFRSSFRDWSGDETSHPREICEAALAHVVGGVEGAYRRATALRKRRQLMCDWSAFVRSETSQSAAHMAIDEGVPVIAEAAE